MVVLVVVALFLPFKQCLSSQERELKDESLEAACLVGQESNLQENEKERESKWRATGD